MHSLQAWFVAAENVFGEINRGVNALIRGVDYERLVLAGGPLGIMAACLDVVIPCIHDRRQFGRAIGEFELMQGKLADMYAACCGLRAHVYVVAGAADSGAGIRKDAAAVILFFFINNLRGFSCFAGASRLECELVCNFYQNEIIND